MFLSMVFHPQVYHGQGGDEATHEQGPCGDKDIHIWNAHSVRTPDPASCCRLQ